MEEQSRSLQDDPWSDVDSNSERELIETPTPKSTPSSEDNIFCFDDSDHVDESSFLCSKSLTTEQSDCNAINSTSVTISVIVHSSSSDLT